MAVVDETARVGGVAAIAVVLVLGLARAVSGLRVASHEPDEKGKALAAEQESRAEADAERQVLINQASRRNSVKVWGR